MSIADTMDSNPQALQQLSTSHTYPFDVSLGSMQVMGIGYVMEALEQRDIKLAKAILTHMVTDAIYACMCVHERACMLWVRVCNIMI